MRVFATARSTKSLSQLEAKGIETLALDVTSADSIAALKAEITKRTRGKLDMLFNNASITYTAPAIEADITGAFFPLLLASVPESRLPPTIINTSSVVSRVPVLFTANYNASKAAVTSYSDTIRLELAPLGIKVVTANSLCIDVEAGVQERIRLHSAESIQPEEFARQVANYIFSNPALGKGEFVWKDSQAMLAWFLNIVGFRKIFDPTMERVVGLNQGTIKKAIYDKGQRSIEQE
ncbi:hypothetical protein IFR05_014293 [Cadophora sp. M221]|nr:hypothetical protein IFR05_014293 [Cadophora sp. M221]